MSIPRRDEDPQWLGLIATGHKEECKFRVATECAIAIECEHGYDVCPKCDPCTCAAE